MGLPLTGAQTNCAPASSTTPRTRADASVETVEESTTTFGWSAPVSRPPGPLITASRSLSAATMTHTMSRSARSTGSSTIFAPNSASGSHLALVRL